LLVFGYSLFERFSAVRWSRLSPTTSNKQPKTTSALSLLVLLVLADDANHAFSLDDLALVADFFNAGSNFHVLFASIVRPEDQSPILRDPMIVPDAG